MAIGTTLTDKAPGASILPNNAWSFRCPSCVSSGLTCDEDLVGCRNCGYRRALSQGIWSSFDAAQQRKYAAFLATYTEVRKQEGRDDYDARTLRALPDCPGSKPMADQWRIRARSFAALMKILSDRLPRSANILDLGAGTGWLSNRLFLAGYNPCALDLSVDEKDGLGAAHAFAPSWPRVQAEFDRLPLPDHCVDAVIFNASFHYCVDRTKTIGEALRVLRSNGLLLILDSPVYINAASGEQMLAEQQQYFETLIGRRSEDLATTGYLTWQQLHDIGNDFDLTWTIDRPWYGIRWVLRPLRARLRGYREPANFAILSATAPAPDRASPNR